MIVQTKFSLLDVGKGEKLKIRVKKIAKETVPPYQWSMAFNLAVNLRLNHKSQ